MTRKHQERMAKAILSGVQKFFTEAPPPGTRLAERQARDAQARDQRGDTLSEIADRYQVSLGSLRRENDIRSENHIRIGQVLVIPDT